MKGFSVFLNRWLPVGLWAGFVLYASTSTGSGDNTAHFLRPILAWIHPDLGLASIPEINFFTRKTAHVVQFVVYAALLWRGLRLPPPVTVRVRDALILVLGSSAVLAILSECIQLFSPMRTAQLTDVGLDLAGAFIAVGLIFAAGALPWRRPRKKILPVAPDGRAPEKILITSDLHLDKAEDQGDGILEQVRSHFIESGADVLLVAGDLGSAEQADEWLALLRGAMGPEAEIVICLGNHDHWLHRKVAGCHCPEDVREMFWRPACHAHRIRCLDFENVTLSRVVICGGYAHYDFGFKDPDLVVDAIRPTASDYRSGRFSGMVYPDMERIPGLESGDEAMWQAKAISRRLSAACDGGKPVLFASHTIPFLSLNAQDVPRDSPYRFFCAYTGNSAIGSLLSAMAPSIAAAVSGHTHAGGDVVRIHGISCVNTGSGPGHLRFLIFDSQNHSVSSFVQGKSPTETTVA